MYRDSFELAVKGRLGLLASCFSARAQDALVRCVPGIALCSFADEAIHRDAVLATRVRGEQLQACFATCGACFRLIHLCLSLVSLAVTIAGCSRPAIAGACAVNSAYKAHRPGRLNRHDTMHQRLRVLRQVRFVVVLHLSCCLLPSCYYMCYSSPESLALTYAQEMHMLKDHVECVRDC